MEEKAAVKVRKKVSLNEETFSYDVKQGGKAYATKYGEYLDGV